MANIQKILDQLKILIFCGMIIFIAQYVNLNGKMNIKLGILGVILMIILSILSVIVKDVTKLKIPSFAWASLFGLLLATPWCPIQKLVLDITKEYSAASISTCILAIAGISIGNKLVDIKKLSWRIVLVALVVFTGTFFGSALVAQFILKMQGII